MNRTQIKDALIPLYKELKDNCSPYIEVDKFTVFFPQLGRHFLEKAGNGILFVGRAVNGWKNTLSQEPEHAANDQFTESMLDCDINKYWSTPSPNGYRCNRSPFWRVISCIAHHFYPENWPEHIAWTNLYKVAPKEEEGNPSGYVRAIQFKACDAILDKEIELLSPKYIVFLTGNWANVFSIYKTLQENGQNLLSEKWGKYISESWTLRGRKYILSKHPQGKPEDAHISALINLMSK